MIKNAMNRSAVETLVERTTFNVGANQHDRLWTLSMKRSVEFRQNYARASPTIRNAR